MHRNTESECFNPHLVIQAYPISYFTSANLRFQTNTGDSLLRCAVSPNRPSSSFLWKSDQFSSLSAKSWAKSLEKPLHLGHIDSSREIPHSMHRLVLRMPLMFKGTSNGYVLFFICFLSMFSSRLFNTHVRALTQMTPTKDAFAAEVIAYWVPN